MTEPYRNDLSRTRTGHRRRSTLAALAVAVVVAVFGLVLGPVPAARAQQSALPADYRAAIDAVSSFNRYGHALESRVAQDLQNRPLGEQYDRQSRTRVDAQMAATVVELIERRPDLARALVDYASRVAPQSAAYVRRSADAAFPAFGLNGPAPTAPAASPAAQAPQNTTTASSYPDWYAPPPQRTLPSYTSAVREQTSRTSPSLSEISPQQPEGFGIPAYMAGAYDRPANLLSSDVSVPVPSSVPPVRSRYTYDVDYSGATEAAAPYPVQAPARVPAAARGAGQQPSRYSYDVDYSGTGTPQAYPPAAGGQQVAVRSAAPRGAAAIEPDVMVDPLEPMNRAIFAVNDVFDQVLFRPLAKLYSYTPLPVRTSMRRFFSNLGEPLVAVNDTLQFDLGDAGTSLGRFAINSTVGLLGLFDPATSFGLKAHHADFGQTLHSYGVGPGPYLVLPLLGPSNARDTVGRVGDVFLDPVTYALWDEKEIRLGLFAGQFLVKREELLDPLDDLRASSVDYYAATRGAYYQNRALELSKGRANGGNKTVDRLFDELE